jgi:tricorn protease
VIVMRTSLPAFALALCAASAEAQNTTDTRLLSQPAVTANRVAFAYAGDLWSARLDGADVRRLTTADGDESNPSFSPDGSLIAFTGSYDGNPDVYVIPALGGEPRRLTYHPSPDIAQGFSPDGKQVLFTSGRNSWTGAFVQLYTVPIQGGVETRLQIPTAFQATFSPDGQRIAFNPMSRAFDQWKRYRGGRVSQIWLYTTATRATDKIPQPASRSNDVDAMWLGDAIYFRSDRDGEFNLHSYDLKSKQVRQLTRHTDFPVLAASAGGGKIIYEQAGYLHLLDTESGQSRKLTIGVTTDLRETRPRWVTGNQYIRSASISPTGARAVFEFRGEIVTLPAEKGDARNLTKSIAAHDRAPAWSRRITHRLVLRRRRWYQLHVAPQDGKGEHKIYKPNGAGFYFGPEWSPDGSHIAFLDNSQSVFVLDLKTGATKKLGGNRVYTPTSHIGYSWSADSRWLAYTVASQALVMSLSVYNVADDKSTRITDGLAAVTEPVFDRSGKYLYVLASTDAGPVLDWFAQSNTNLPSTASIYAIVLRKDIPNPVARESDEEKASPEAGGQRPEGAPPDSAARATPRDSQPSPAASRRPATVAIDFDGIEQRIVALPINAANLHHLQTGEAGMLFYERTADGTTSLHRYDLNKRQDATFLPNVGSYEISADSKKMLYSSQGAWFVAGTAAAPTAGQGRLATTDIEVRIDPRAEWPQIFDEAWRVNRDYFYAPNMHGVDWPAAKRKYAPLLADATTKADVNRVIQWMMSELSVGHHRGGGGDRLTTARNVPGGLLGADYDIANGRYRFARIYGGLNWTPSLRAPLTEPGVNVRPGEYLLAVRGIDVRPPANLYAFFENTANKLTEITVGPDADGTGSRTVQVVPIANEAALRNRAWVEGNLRKVDLLTGGRVAYVCANTAQPGTTTSSAISIRRRTRKRSSSTSATTVAATSRITTSTSCAARSSAIGPCGTVTICARRPRRYRGRRCSSPMRTRARGATSSRGCGASSDSAPSSANAHGAVWSASWDSPCSWTVEASLPPTSPYGRRRDG